MIDGPLREWPRAFPPDRWVRFLAQTPSTQDVARQLASRSEPRIFIAARQTRGRGSRGRAWSDPHGLGLAMTISLPSSTAPSGSIDRAILPLACGLAVLDAVTQLAAPRPPRLGLKWPNDVMHVDDAGRGVRKLGGILIEAVDDCVLAGIGINVHQQEADFERSLQPEAVSLRQLGVRVARPALAAATADSLIRLLRAPGASIVDRWKQHDALKGVRCAFEHDGRTSVGTVLRIEPTQSIELQLDHGETVVLPAATTSRVRSLPPR